MKKITLLLLFISSITFSQTKKIFHKSHSGKSGTLFMDSKNNFGPGMAPVRYRTPESSIKLNYVVSNNNQYPIVNLDTANRVMRFYDLQDSLLGCDRDYLEYLSHGDIVFDIISKEYWVYQRYEDLGNNYKILTHKCFKITDSLDAWEANPNLITMRNAFIRDGENKRILMSYPVLDWILTSNIYATMFESYQSFPNKLGEEMKSDSVNHQKKKLSKREKRKKAKKARKYYKIKTEPSNEDEEIIFGITTPESPGNNWLIWLGIFFFGFSIFIFIGVQQIVKEELSKIKQ